VAEAAAIARGLRELLGRRAADGDGELLAAAARARGTAPSAPAPPRAPGDPGAGPPPAALAPAPAPASVLEVDLFGRPRPRAAAAAPEAPPAAAPRLDLDDRLHPAGLAARAFFQEEATRLLDEVAAEARACRRCGLCETRSQAVPGVGSARSGIVFVGEAPGAEEDRQGEPFVGRAGELLTRIIRAMDEARLIPGVPFSRDTVYICNVLKCRPPENRNPLPHEIESCAPYLRRQLAALRPRLICCLGKFAAELLVGVKGTIGGLRGRVYRYQGAKLIVTYHPAACLRNPAYKRPVWEDMQLLAREYLKDGGEP
jgi:DNA polymerase